MEIQGGGKVKKFFYYFRFDICGKVFNDFFHHHQKAHERESKLNNERH